MKTKTSKAFIKIAIILIVFILTLCSKASAQESDSVSMMMITSEQAIGFITKNLRISHNEFKAGWIVSASGSALLIASALIPATTHGADPRDIRQSDIKPMAAMFGVLSIAAGAIIMIDSHAKIGNCGRVYITPVGLVLKMSK